MANLSSLLINGYEAWTSENMGAGSGLDADLLDGLQNTSFLRTDSDSTLQNGYRLTISGILDISNGELLVPIVTIP